VGVYWESNRRYAFPVEVLRYAVPRRRQNTMFNPLVAHLGFDSIDGS
jgi:hypothetical protein